MSESKLKLLIALLLLFSITIFGTLGLAAIEEWDFITALWLIIVSLTTTGYGDILPVTMQGRLFLLVMLVLGVGVVAYCFGAITNVLVESQISRVIGRDKRMKAIRKMNQHIIVCGAGRVGLNTMKVLESERIPFVVVDQDEEVINQLEEEGYFAIHGDATQDEVLESVGIEKARGIVCALSEDAYNVFITLTARAKNPDLRIVARAEQPETVSKLQRAGADQIICPAKTSGYQMAMAMLKPSLIDFDNGFTISRKLQLQSEELTINEESLLAGRRVGDVFDRNKNGLLLVAIIRKRDMKINPEENETLLSGDTIIVIGSHSELDDFQQML
ncbi:MAG: potassium channel protein [Bacillota bacterium]|nr:potassium channel protein [Bacillota bacterium]